MNHSDDLFFHLKPQPQKPLFLLIYNPSNNGVQIRLKINFVSICNKRLTLRWQIVKAELSNPDKNHNCVIKYYLILYRIKNTDHSNEYYYYSKKGVDQQHCW